MKRFLTCLALGVAVCSFSGDAAGRGFGGFRGGGGFGGGYGAYRGGGFGGDRFGGWGGGGYHYSASGGDRFGGSYSSSRDFNSDSGYRGAGFTGSYDHTWDTARGGSITTEGERGAAYGRYGGAAAGGMRTTDITTAGGRTYSGSSERGAAVGPGGRAIAGSEGERSATGPRGTASESWKSAYAGGRFPTDFGLAHYSSFNAAGVNHNTVYWSHGYMNTTGVAVRSNFNYYHCFYPDWWRRYPGSWYAAGWAAGAAWSTATWAALDNYVGFAGEPPYTYDFGSNVVYQNNNVYIGGQDSGTVQQYTQQATDLATAGQTAEPPATADWKPLGVFALVQGAQKTSNNIFQLAVDKNGIIRGNYYDGVMDTTTPVYGSVSKKNQLAAWTIGKSKDRVFEAGLYNLTQPEAPVMVHFGADKSQQWLLVRVEQPASK